jgi:hypothetical protein
LNDHELQRFEAELRRAAPAPLPEEFRARLRTAKLAVEPAERMRLEPMPGWARWWRLGRWAAPAMAAAVVGLMVGKGKVDLQSIANKKPMAVADGLKANDVRVDHELVNSFDVVATMPDGLPVRFRCRQWKDQLVVTDKSRGVEIQQDSPLVEVVPVRFETY